ncbi:MAG: family 10 glycosylhydrolase [Kiritimatiellae bacterium]|nr:family 10 glycosylhydrolase [Kiritimatiellia bacterium]
MKRMFGCFLRNGLIAALLLAVSTTAMAVDVREKYVFKGPFNMKTATGVEFSFDCDDAASVCRRYVYFKSGEGYYKVPFNVSGNGRTVVSVDRIDCLGAEGKVAGWENIEEILVSFWREDVTPVKWKASGLEICRKPYNAVVVMADAATHVFPRKLEACGMIPLFLDVKELDAGMLDGVALVVPIGNMGKFPKKAMEIINRFKSCGGVLLSSKERLAATTHRQLLQLLKDKIPELGEEFARKLAEDEAQRKKDAEAAARFPAFMLDGGEDEIRGIDCHVAYGPERVGNDPKWENWDENCRMLKAAGFNALNVNVARGGIVFYESKVLPMSPEVKTKGDSIELIKKACEKHGMKFIAWKVCFYSRVGMKTPEFEKWIADGRGALSADGKKSTEWLCPVRPENRALEIEALVELAKRGPWAISLDYIRYHGTTWCYCGHCRKAFEEFAGEKVSNWPKDAIAGGRLDGKWEEFRRRNITELVREVSRRVRAEAPGVKIRVDVFCRPNGNALSVAQEWDRWCREGLLDMVCPMNGMSGSTSKEGISDLLKIQIPASAGVPLVPTYYPSLMKRTGNADDFMNVIRAGRKAGIKGFCTFTFDGRLIEMLGLGEKKTSAREIKRVPVESLPLKCTSTETVKGQAPSLLPVGRKMKLVWNDEFDGDRLDDTKWGYRTNFWGRQAHWFAKPEDNSVEVKDGLMKMKLVKRPDGQFVSPQLQTGEIVWDGPHDPNAKGFWPLIKREKPKFMHRYGYYECRCRLQQERGWWSAFWMQAPMQGTCLDPRRAGIEHDIMESFHPGELIPHCFHANGYGADHQLFMCPRLTVEDSHYYSLTLDKTEFHVFGFLWEPDGYTIFIDGRQHGPKVGMGDGEEVSHTEEFLLLTTEAKFYRKNRMTGKASPDLEAAYAAGDAFIVDYVRVYDLAD